MVFHWYAYQIGWNREYFTTDAKKVVGKLSHSLIAGGSMNDIELRESSALSFRMAVNLLHNLIVAFGVIYSEK